MRAPTLNGFQNQYQLMAQQYQVLNELYAHQASQKNLINASDDPVLAAKILSIQQYLTDISSYKQNTILAENRTTLLETAAKGAVNIADQIKQLVVSANNDTLSDNDRLVIANQMQGLLKDLVGISNRQDGTNNYLFSGSSQGVQPFSISNNKYVYNGSQENTYISISTNVSTIYSQSGDAVFNHIFSGNGTFAVTANSANTGAASTSSSTVSDPSAYVEDNYTLTFVTNAAGHLAYQITGATTGQVVPPPPATIPGQAPDYSPDMAINFNGVNLTFNGTPNAGDTFDVKPSTPDNVFNYVTSIINQLRNPIGSDTAKRAQFHQMLSQSGTEIAQIFNHFIGFESEIGQRTISIKSQSDINEQLVQDSTKTLSTLNDVDPVKLTTDLSRQLVFIQATQTAYARIQSVMMDLVKSI